MKPVNILRVVEGEKAALDDANLVERIVIGAIRGVSNTPADQSVTRDTELSALELDSLDFAVVLILIEDAAGAEVPASALERLAEMGEIRTVGDVLLLLDGWDPGQP